jgi:hypothetical protein
VRVRLIGAAKLSIISGAIAATIRWLVNPWFMDQPTTYAFFSLVPLLALGWWLGPWLPGDKRAIRPALISVLLFALSAVPPLAGPVPAKLVIVGIDGATWDVADRLSLPQIQGLTEQGKRGTLMANPPLFSPLLWTTLATGTAPEVHGIQGLKVQADQATAARFWDVARASGLSVGLYKWLVSWPPPTEEMPGFTVPAWLAADASTHPSHLSWVKALELSNRARRKRVPTDRSRAGLALDGISDGLRWSTIWAGIRFAAMERLSPLPERKRDAFLRRLRLRIDRDVFIAQLHRTHPDLASFTIYLTDALSHTHWSRDGGRYVDSAYRMSDAILGEIREAVGPETTVMVLSDHGFRNAGERPGVYAAVPKIDALESWLEGQVGEVDIVRVGRKLVVTPDVPVADEVLERVLGTLAFSDGEPLYRSEVFPRAAGWSLSIAHLPPKGDWADVEIAGVALTELVRAGRTEEGEHDPAGILVMAGPGVGQGDFGVVSQLDVMPTILAILGLPVAEDLPGTALVEERVARVPTHAGLAPAGAAAGALNNADRLRELGYID